MLPIDLKTLMPIHAYSYRKIKLTYCAIHIFDCTKPIVCTELFGMPGIYTFDFSTQVSGRINKMTAWVIMK